jgi:hypothetical protein
MTTKRKEPWIRFQYTSTTRDEKKWNQVLVKPFLQERV